MEDGLLDGWALWYWRWRWWWHLAWLRGQVLGAVRRQGPAGDQPALRLCARLADLERLEEELRHLVHWG